MYKPVYHIWTGFAVTIRFHNGDKNAVSKMSAFYSARKFLYNLRISLCLPSATGTSCRRRNRLLFLLNIKHYTSLMRATCIGNSFIVFVNHQRIQHSRSVTLFPIHALAILKCDQIWKGRIQIINTW